MAQRSFDDALWGDDVIQELAPHAKLLFIYLWTNTHCNSAGLYRITNRTVSFETGIPAEELPELFTILENTNKIKRQPEDNIVWVRSFLKYQSKSPKFLTGVARSLLSVSANGIIPEYLSYYQALGYDIPYQYPMDTVSVGYAYPADHDHDSDNDNDIDNTMDTKQVYGEFKNVKLSDKEHQKLVERYSEKQVAVMIETLSGYKKSKGKRYKDDYATILNWFRRDEKDGTNQGNNKGAGNTGGNTGKNYKAGKYGHIVE